MSTNNKGRKEDLITLHMDTLGFAEKPGERAQSRENTVPGLIYRASRNIVTISKEELAGAILQGYSFIPGVCPMDEERKKDKSGGCKQEDWEKQQIWALDFDSAIDKGEEESHLEEVVAKLQKLGIPPFFAYGSFSDGKVIMGQAVEKFRVLFASEEEVCDMGLRDRLQATLMGLFAKQIDRSCSNRNRYYNGTRPDARSYLDYDAVIDADWIVDQYWNEQYRRFFPGEKKKKGEKRSQKEAVVKTKRADTLFELMPVEEFPDFFPSVHHGLIKYDMKMHCEEFFSFINAKEWVEGERRRNYIFGAFNMAAFTYGTREAYARCIELNSQFAEPLSEKEFFANIKSALEHVEENCEFIHEEHYVFRYDTLIESIDLPEEVKKELGYFKNKLAKEHANRLRPLKQERDALMMELKEKGLGAKRIRKQLMEKYGEDSELALSLEGVKWFLKKKVKKGGSIGTTTLNTNFFTSPSNGLLPSLEKPTSCERRNGFEMKESPIPFEEQSFPTLNQRQRAAYNDALLNSNLFITGGAGTGKSFLIERIIESLTKEGKNVGVCALSALAAQAYDNGVTFHRLFEYRGNDYVYLSTLEKLSVYDVFVIEEAGMLGKKAMDYLGAVVTYLWLYHQKSPQIILLGDVMQLPPIGDTFFFNSDAFSTFHFQCHYLIENIRQQGSDEFFHCLNAIRVGVKAWEEVNRICNHGEDLASIYLVPKNKQLEQKNKECLERVEGELIDLGEGLFVKIGAKIICKKNCYKDGKIYYYNGMQGTVIKVSPKRQVVTILNTKGEKIRIRKCNVQEEPFIWTWKFPFQLGYAITIHASQGMTLESANIDPRAFAGGQLYVALSRVKTAEGVHLMHPVSAINILCSKSALKFDTEVREACESRLVIEEEEYDNERG